MGCTGEVTGRHALAFGVDPYRLDVELFSASTKQWRPAGSLLFSRPETGTVLNDGRVLATGGLNAQAYDYLTDTWQDVGPMQYSHSLHGAALLADGTLLVAGGIDTSVPDVHGYPEGEGRQSARAELFDANTGLWTGVPNMISGRRDFTLTAVGDGTALAVGGVGATFYDCLIGCVDYPESRAEIFEP